MTNVDMFQYNEQYGPHSSRLRMKNNGFYLFTDYRVQERTRAEMFINSVELLTLNGCWFHD